MASILTADLPSDDEQDDDFDPSKDDGGSDTEKKKRSSASKKRLRQGGPLASGITDAELSEEVCKEQEKATVCCGASLTQFSDYFLSDVFGLGVLLLWHSWIG